MSALQEQLCKQDNSENSAFSVSTTQTKEFIASIDYNYHQHGLDICMKGCGFSRKAVVGNIWNIKLAVA